MIQSYCIQRRIQVNVQLINEYCSFLTCSEIILKIFWLGSLGLDGFVLDDEEFISGDFNDDRDDIKELEADNYEDQLSQPEVISTRPQQQPLKSKRSLSFDTQTFISVSIQ